MLTTGKSKFHQAHLDEIQYFVDCLQNDSTPSPSGEDGLKDLEAIEKAYKNQIRLN
jgi:predicted dehydrogenase